MRASISLVVIALAVAGSVGEAAAQSYPPPPPADYYPEPPAPYPSQPQPYISAPLPGPYDPGYDEQAAASPPPGRPYFVPEDRMAPQPLPAIGGELIPRPPADVTGSIFAPAGAATGPAPDRTTVIAALPPEERPEQGPPRALPPQFRRQLVDYVTAEPAGTVIIDTPHTYLYLVRGNGKALRYGIGVGREGFTWSGGERISRMSEWPDWHPPKEMIERQPYLPRFMAGGEGNPLGARALYLGNTLYRVHGTNQPSTIGSFVSSGCIRLTNEDIEDLYSRVNIGTRVVVLPGSPGSPGSPPTSASAQSPMTR